MVVTKQKKKEYNERYRSKIKELKELKEENEQLNEKITPKVDNKQDFFLTLRNKILETSIMAAIPIVLKIVHYQFSKQQLKMESKQDSKQLQDMPQNPLNNIQMSHNF